MSARREGDLVILENGRVTATFDPGGTVTGLGPGSPAPVQISLVAGVRSGDAVAVERTALVDESPDRVAVELTAGLLGAEDIRVTTRYELRPCEDGLRVRSELENRGADVLTLVLADLAVWQRPALDLDGLARTSFSTVVVEREQAAYGFATCDSMGSLDGVNRDRTSMLGTAPVLLRPGERLLFERLLLTAADAAAAQAAIGRIR